MAFSSEWYSVLEKFYKVIVFQLFPYLECRPLPLILVVLQREFEGHHTIC